MTMPRFPAILVALACATVIGQAALAQGEASVTERNRLFIAQSFDRWAEGGKTFFQDVLAPDVTWTIKGTSPVAGTYNSRDAFLQRAVAPFAARLASPVRPTLRNLWADGDHVIAHWDGVATATDGATYRNSYVWIFRMKDLRATEVTAFLDLVPYDDVIRRIPLAQ